MQAAGIPFRVLIPDTDEDFPDYLPPGEVAGFLAKKKSDAFEHELDHPGTILITADTIVVIDGMILNKPSGFEEAGQMLERLSGRWHEVHTGVCIRMRGRMEQFTETSRVLFRILNQEEIAYYIKKYRPFDKAGSYGIQDWIGTTAIARIEGSYPNVAGLPIHRVYETIRKMVG